MPTLSEPSLRAWNAFGGNTHWMVLHPLDTERFARFVIEVYRNGDRVERFSSLQWRLGALRNAL